MFKKKGTPTVVDVKPKTTKMAAPPLFAVNSIRPPQQAEDCTVMISINVKTMRKSAEMLKKLFEGHGISTWICCQIKGGNDFRDEIVKAVKTCKVFLILMNNEWAASGECKDEFNLAKRLNLTSHETERTVSGQQRLPAIVPIAFPNLLWTGHAHVELLAANTNFLVHDNKDLVGKPADSLLRQLVQSVVDLNVKGISDNLGLRTLSASHHEEEVGGEASGSSEGVVERLAGSCDKEVHDVAQQLAKLSQQMLEVQNSLGDIRAASAKQVKQKQSPTVTVGPAQAVAQAAPAPELPNFDRMDPRHFRDQYLGMIVESYPDHRLSWSLELVIQKKSKPAKDHTIKFTGYIRWRMLSCRPKEHEYNKKIEADWAADELVEGHANLENHSLLVKNCGMRAVPGNACKNPAAFIGTAVYSLVMDKKGQNISGCFWCNGTQKQLPDGWMKGVAF